MQTAETCVVGQHHIQPGASSKWKVAGQGRAGALGRTPGKSRHAAGEHQLSQEPQAGAAWTSRVMATLYYPWLTHEKGSPGQKDILHTAQCHVVQGGAASQEV